MGNTANRQCPNCRSLDIHQSYVGIRLVFRCQRCGYVWNAQ
jgi:uncharacterized Zn finger protein